MCEDPIGIFDSGIGGLTVLKELEKVLPEENFIYLGDTLNFPYGDKTKEEIIQFSKKNIEYLISQKVKMVIIACGTATSQSLAIMQKMFDIPIMGIIEPTVEYVKEINLKRIGVIATTGTIRSGAWEKSLKQEIPNIEVISEACPLLASMAEEGKATSKESLDAIHNYMEVFKRNHIDTIVLGCTHYPIYEEIIKKEFLDKVNLINTGEAVAKKVKSYLIQNKLQRRGTKIQSRIVISKKEDNFDKIAKNILKSGKKLDITYFY